jgi:hypothetical protein
VREEIEGETSSQSLEGRKDHDHILVVGEIRVSLRKGIREKANEDVAFKEVDIHPTYFFILEDIGRIK